MKSRYYLLLSFVLLICSATSFAYQNSVCKVKDQSGSLESSWCSNHHQEGSWRCYAEVEFPNGAKEKVWGNRCHSSFSPCHKDGEFSVEPSCASISETYQDNVCKIKNQSGSLESSWCSNHHQEGNWRCYAEVEFANGAKEKVWGNRCHSSFSPCDKDREFSVEPSCAVN